MLWGTIVSSSSESMDTDDMLLKQADHMSDLLRDIPGIDVGGTQVTFITVRFNVKLCRS